MRHDQEVAGSAVEFISSGGLFLGIYGVGFCGPKGSGISVPRDHDYLGLGGKTKLGRTKTKR